MASLPVLRTCRRDGWIRGCGIGDVNHRQPFRFPTAGNRFEWPGPELVAIPDVQHGANEYREPDWTQGEPVRLLHEEGLHAHMWGLPCGFWPDGRQYGDEIRLDPGELVLVLEVEAGPDAPGYVQDKWRAGNCSGKCRVKRGVVAYAGDVDRAIDYLGRRWAREYPEQPAPSWDHLRPGWEAPPYDWWRSFPAPSEPLPGSRLYEAREREQGA